MRGCVWAALLNCIPADQHNILMLVTRCGTEIAVQNILRVDNELLAIKGRLAGSQDTGRLYFVPLDNIDYFGFNRMVKDEEYAAIFGNFQPPPEVVAAPAAAQEQPASEPAPAAPQQEALSEPPPVTPVKPTLAIKSAVLERFRARNTGATLPGPKPPSEST
jgi:hypothetical protein